MEFHVFFERILILICVLAVAAVSAEASDECSVFRNSVLEQIALKNRIQENRFETSRGIDLYHFFLGDEFADDLAKLRKSNTWVDMGSGDGRAIFEYSTGIQQSKRKISPRIKELITRLPEHKAKVMGVSYAEPKIVVENSKRAQYKYGKFFEQMPIGEFPRTDLITDFYGVFSYTDNPTVVLDRYLQILKLNGSAYLYGDWNLTKILTANGETITVLDWLKKVKGLQVEAVKNVEYLESGQVTVLKITRTKEKIQVPKLVNRSISDDGPPKRVFHLEE